MKKITVEMTRIDKVEVELDPEFFNDAWFEDFNKYFYDYEDLSEVAEYITYNIVHNRSSFIEGIGIPLIDGGKPYGVEEDEVNEHVNVIYNPYATEVECDSEDSK